MFHRLAMLGTVGAVLLSASSAFAAGPAAISGKTPDGGTYTVRALTATQVAARGLSRYVNSPTFSVTTPIVVDSPEITAVMNKTGSSVATTTASGCWSFSSRYAINGNWMWGQDDVTWCGGGTWVTYATSHCYGGSWYPTYNFQGCNHNPNFGVGWNLYQVKDTWDFCIAYVPIWGSCVTHQYPWKQYQYLGNGRVLFNGGW
jgi:hypothetical protein